MKENKDVKLIKSILRLEKFMVNKKNIFPIGIGTWKINYQDNKDIEALFHSYKLGQNYLSLYMLYEDGNIVKSLKSFIEKCGRENLFISVNIEPTVNENLILKSN